MRIGILGSGEVGRVLASAFLQEGHQVMLGTRDKAKTEVVKWQGDNSGGTVGSFSETAIFGELLVLAVGGLVVEDVINLAGKDNFSNKTLIDATNPIAAVPPQNGVLKFFTTLEESLMERIQGLIPEAHVVKAFNSVGNIFMYKPPFKEAPTMFICGNNEEAKKEVTSILTSFGWETEDMGKVEAARAIEPLCILWCIPGFIRNQWTHAFKLLKV
jgi:8-hydroxy-5-deazaflavin:NADPH oxidoreductase